MITTKNLATGYKENIFHFKNAAWTAPLPKFKVGTDEKKEINPLESNNNDIKSIQDKTSDTNHTN